MPSLRERLKAQRWSDIAPRNWFAIDGDMIDEVDAVLAAAEAWAQAKRAERNIVGPDGLLVEDFLTVHANAARTEHALLALFPPPNAKESK